MGGGQGRVGLKCVHSKWLLGRTTALSSGWEPSWPSHHSKCFKAKFHHPHPAETKSKAQRAHLTHPKPSDLCTEVGVGVGVQGTP